MSQNINSLIQKRRSIFPSMYSGQPVDDKLIEQLLENANWAPNHRKTEPWRFKVYTGEALGKLGDCLANLYQKHVPAEKFSSKKQEKTAQKPRKCSHVIVICMQRDEAERVPEWEEMCAVACAVQNMWLTATANGLGAYWSSPGYMKRDEMREFLGLNSGEQCLGFFYVGHYDGPDVPAQRKPIEDKVVWVRE